MKVEYEQLTELLECKTKLQAIENAYRTMDIEGFSTVMRALGSDNDTPHYTQIVISHEQYSEFVLAQEALKGVANVVETEDSWNLTEKIKPFLQLAGILKKEQEVNNNAE